ncbi:MAG: PAS domain S-box protein [Deltaproteobacteria bacterium]
MAPQKKQPAKSVTGKAPVKGTGVQPGKAASKPSKKPVKKQPALPDQSTCLTGDLLDSIVAGIYLARQGRYIAANRTYEKLTGRAAADLGGKKILDYIHPDDREEFQKNQKKQSGDPYEYRLIREKGEVIWLRETTAPIVHQGAKTMLGSVMDITRYKQTEESMALKEERYGALLQEIADNYFEADLNGSFTFVNDALVRHIGYAKEELLGMNYRQYCDAATAEKMKELYADVYQTGKPFSGFVAQFIAKDGSIRFAEVSGALIRDKQGKPVGFRGLSRDVTLRRQEEEARRRAEERYRIVLEEINEGYGELDLAGNWIFVNEAAAKNLGYTPAEMIGKNYRQVTDEDSAQKMFEAYNNLYETGDPFKGLEVEFFTKQGNRRMKELSAALIRDEKGEPIGFRGLARDITERKWAEDALLQSEAKYFSIIESIGEAYFETDITGVMTFINDRVCRDLGYTREELLRMSNRDLQDEASAQETYAIFNEVYETGLPVKEFEYKARRKDGSLAIFELSISLMRDAEGKPIGFRGLSRDITERKKMESALRQSEEKYRTIIETIEDGYFESDLAGNWTFVNDVVCEQLGYSRMELIGMNFRQLQDEESIRKSFKIFTEVYRTGKPIKSLEVTGLRKDKTKGVYEISVSLIEDSKGQPTGFRSISRDITERKKMEDALRASEERARTLITTIPDPYFENDLQGKFTYVNTAFKNLSGYSPEEMPDLNYRVFMDEASAEKVFTLYSTVFKTGLPMKNVELDVITKSGAKRLVDISVSLIRDSRSSPSGFHGILRDITEKKKAEELIRQSEQSLREYSETLELRVRERTAELEKSKIAAEAASRAKSDFMASMSHEFQTPLNAIIGFTRVLQDRMFGELNDKQEEFIRYVAEAGASLSRIITEILDATHVSSGNIKLNLSSVSIVDVLSKTNKLLAMQMKEKNQILTVDVDLDADIAIEADEQKIQQVFFHLLSNAVKYNTDCGKVDVRTVRTRHGVSGQEGISVAIRDTGIGIKAEDMPKLFQTFGTLGSPYTRPGKGIGMGLSLTKQLVELHGGDITVESEYGRGSCFTIFLPLKQKQTGAAE